jgi:hypothetical protein
LKDTNHAVALLRKIVPTILMVILVFLSGILLLFPIEHYNPPQLETLLSLNLLESPLNSVLRKQLAVVVSLCLFGLGVAALFLTYAFFHALPQLLPEYNKLVVLSQQLSVVRSHVGILFQLQNKKKKFGLDKVYWKDYFSGGLLKKGNQIDHIGIAMVVGIGVSYCIPIPIISFVMILNSDPLLHVILNLSTRFKVFSDVFLQIYQLFGSRLEFNIIFFATRLLLQSLLIYECARVCALAICVIIPWLQMCNRNAVLITKIVKYVIFQGRQQYCQHIKLYRQLWLCTSFLKDWFGVVSFMWLSWSSFVCIAQNYFIFRHGKDLDPILLSVLIYLSIAMVIFSMVDISFATKLNEEMIKIRRVIEEGTAKLSGYNRKIVAREIKGVPEGMMVLCFPGPLIISDFSKTTKIILIRVILELTLNALITFK